jgi:membrane protease YdiL (CAAX protease family)
MRGSRCFGALHRVDHSGWLTASLGLTPSSRLQGVRKVEVNVSRRLTPWMVWPVLSMLIGFIVIIAAPRRAPSSPEGGPAESAPAPVDRPWSGAWSVLAYTGLLIAEGFVSVLYMALAGGSWVIQTGTFTAIMQLVHNGLLALCAGILLGAFGRKGDVRTSLGLVPIGFKEFWQAVGLGLALVALAAVSTHFIKDVSQSQMGQMVEHVPIRYAIGFGALLAPLSEEVFFRGVLVRAFGKQSALAGIAGSALLFTLAHVLQLAGAWAGLVPICGVALVNGWLRVKSRGVTQPWVVHAVYNSALSVGLYFG